MAYGFQGRVGNTRKEPRAAQLRGADSAARYAEAARADVNGHALKSCGEAVFNGLLTNTILTELPGEDFVRLLPYLEPVSLVYGEVLCEAGSKIRYAYFPETSVISQLHLLADGSTTEAALIGREGMVGLSAIFNSPPSAHLTHVMIEGNALRIRGESLRQEFGRGGALQQSLLAYAGARIAQVSQRAVCNGRHSVEQRLCVWLLMINDRAPDADLPLTHELIAGHLGVRRAGITGAANSLRDRGMIEYSRGVLCVLDRRGLEAAACECYDVLRQASFSIR
ncbi:MAG TPA: Crp/Fnr family transcriptional regulator [Pyrinomonadaceae bacterium]